MERIFEGAITHIGDMQEGTSANGKSWNKVEFVVTDESGTYPETGVFTLFGDKAANMKYHKVGSLVQVKYNLKAKEYKGRWFQELSAWGVFAQARADKEAGAVSDAMSEDDGLNLPF